MMDLAKNKCGPCEGNTRPLSADEARGYAKRLNNWQITDDTRGIYRLFTMKSFMAAIRFINEIASIAETENHHPDVHLTGYRTLRVELSTHAIKGLSENDFIVAAKIDRLTPEIKE